MKISRRTAITQSVLAFFGALLPWGGVEGKGPLGPLKWTAPTNGVYEVSFQGCSRGLVTKLYPWQKDYLSTLERKLGADRLEAEHKAWLQENK